MGNVEGLYDVMSGVGNQEIWLPGDSIHTIG
jgi:hypothetical protein